MSKRKLSTASMKSNIRRKSNLGRVIKVKRKTGLGAKMGSVTVTPATTFGKVYGKGECKCVDGPATTDPWYNSTNTASALFLGGGTNGSFVLLNSTLQGAGLHNRIGNRISMKSLRIRGCINPNFVGAANGGNVRPVHLRISVIYDRQPGSSFPNSNVVYQSRDYQGGLHSQAMNFFNIDNSSRFYTIYDQMWYIPTGNSNINETAAPVNNEFSLKYFRGCNDGQWYFDIFKKLKGLETKYISNNSPMTVADFAVGALYLIAYSDQDMSIATSAQWGCDFSWRIRFYDT
jgi:hypothetical protein